MVDVLDVGVIGSVNRDSVERPGLPRREGLGGVLYTACALAHLGRGRLRVWPLARISTDVIDSLPQRLGAPPGLRLDGLSPIAGPGYRCRVAYDADGGKSELLTGDVEPLRYAELAPRLPGLGALLVNFITGFEIDLSTLRQVRTAFGGPILMDLHSLTLERQPDGRRQARCPQAWEQWVALADVVQMNAFEAAVLGAGDAGDGEALSAFAESLLALGPQGSVVTRGAAGAIGSWRTAEGRLLRLRQAAPAVADPAFDATGCGDVFLAAFAAEWLLGSDPATALGRAVCAATRKGSLDGLDELHRLAHPAPDHEGTEDPCRSSSTSPRHRSRA